MTTTASVEIGSKTTNNNDNNKLISHLRLENLKCPIHVAIENGQLRVVSLMIKRDSHVIEHSDGYGTTPLRLALRNRHTDETKRRNQRDVARFIMGYQFDNKVSMSGGGGGGGAKLSSSLNDSTTINITSTAAGGTVVNSSSTGTALGNGPGSINNNPIVTSISLRMRYKAKCWVEKARDRVIVTHGLAKSSMPKKKILLRTGLVGNKVAKCILDSSTLE